MTRARGRGNGDHIRRQEVFEEDFVQIVQIVLRDDMRFARNETRFSRKNISTRSTRG